MNLWRLSLHSAFAASIMKVTYGIEVKDSSNEYVHIAEEVITGFNEAAQPGHFLVDNIEWRKCGKDVGGFTLTVLTFGSEIYSGMGPRSWLPTESRVLQGLWFTDAQQAFRCRPNSTSKSNHGPISMSLHSKLVPGFWHCCSFHCYRYDRPCKCITGQGGSRASRSQGY